jgi:hypothetical protein
LATRVEHVVAINTEARRYKRCGGRLPRVIVPILIAATLALMAVADLLIVISGLFYIAGKAKVKEPCLAFR